MPAMPILFVKDTQPHPKNRVRKMLQAVNRAVCDTLGLSPNSVWVRYEAGRPDDYWEGESGRVPKEGRPVFVLIQLVEGRKEPERLFAAVSSAIGKAFGMDPFLVWMRLIQFPLESVGQGDKSYAELRKKK